MALVALARHGLGFESWVGSTVWVPLGMSLTSGDDGHPHLQVAGGDQMTPSMGIASRAGHRR